MRCQRISALVSLVSSIRPMVTSSWRTVFSAREAMLRRTFGEATIEELGDDLAPWVAVAAAGVAKGSEGHGGRLVQAGHVRGASAAECGEGGREPLGLGDELARETERVRVALQSLLAELVVSTKVPRGEGEPSGVVVDRRALDLASLLEAPREGHRPVR